MNEVEFLPDWYPRRRKRRARLFALLLVAVCFTLGFAVQRLWN
jgi:hypothetical protein